MTLYKPKTSDSLVCVSRVLHNICSPHRVPIGYLVRKVLLHKYHVLSDLYEINRLVHCLIMVKAHNLSVAASIIVS